MTHAEFRTYLENQQPALKAWGDKIVAELQGRLLSKFGEYRYSTFLKIPTVPRLKQIESAIGKLLIKKYSDPTLEMTDLIGARFVVLLRTDIDLIVAELEGSTSWKASCDRDYHVEIENDPHLFDYQSVHYVLRANGDTTHDGIEIPNDTACEVQIRTLLQHAYAEIVHDNIYKPSGVVPPQSKRMIAKSMALMETTDDLFCDTISELKTANAFRNNWNNNLNKFYIQKTTPECFEPDTDFNYKIIDTYHHIITSVHLDELATFIDERPHIIEEIKQRREDSFLFRQPSTLLLYFLIKKSSDEVKKAWPFDNLQDDLNIIFSRLGVAFSTSTL